MLAVIKSPWVLGDIFFLQQHDALAHRTWCLCSTVQLQQCKTLFLRQLWPKKAAPKWTQLITVQDLRSHTASRVWVASQQYCRNQAASGLTPANHAKNYQNRLICVEVIVCNISVVFETQCSLHALHFSNSALYCFYRIVYVLLSTIFIHSFIKNLPALWRSVSRAADCWHGLHASWSQLRGHLCCCCEI